MADPVSLASGSLALATFAFQSSITLINTVKSFQSHPKHIRDLMEELEALSMAIGSLTDTVRAATDVDLSALDLPLLRCGETCREFELEIKKCSSRSGGSQMSIRDWAKLRYMGEDIDGFRRLLARYKLTINIALTDANLRKSFVTAEMLKNYEELIKIAKADLEAHLESIDEKLELMSRQTVAGSNSDSSELQPIKEERSSTEKCLQICTWLSDQYSTSASDNLLKVPTKITKGLSDWKPDEDDSGSGDSDNESIFTHISDVSSATSSPETANARMEVAYFLLNNNELRHLFEIALEKFDMKKIKRHLKSFISSYGAMLGAEASNPLQQDISNFVHNSAMQVTAYMTQVMMRKTEVEQLSKGNQVNNLLQSLKSGQRSSHREMVSFNDKDEGGTSDDESNKGDLDKDNLNKQIPLQTLESVKEFMISAKAFGILVDGIKIWLGIEIENIGGDSEDTDRSEVESLVPMAKDVDFEPSSQFTESQTISDQSNIGIQSHTTQTIGGLISDVANRLQKMLWPPPPKGFKRITWRSALGRTLYIDVKECFDGAAERLQNRFTLSTTKRPVSRPSTNRMLTVSLTPQRSPLEPTQSRLPVHSHRDPIQLRNLSSSTSSTALVPEATDRRYLLLCLSTSKAEVFRQIDVTNITNDQYLFESIHETYCDIRKEECWYSKLYFLRRLSIPPWLMWFSSLHLYAPKQMNFVSFNLMPLRRIPTPFNIKTPSLPPASEVLKKRNWHYEPCPREIEDYSISAACVQQLLEPGHAFWDNIWLDLFPKKLRDELSYKSGKITVAWGINIVEGINVAVVAWLGLLILITSGLLGTLYSAITRDTGGGFALAAWFGSCSSLSILYLQFRI